MHQLYVKTHNLTGLKYLGKTVKNPFTYKGSGHYWLRHIKKHGNDVTTDILSRCNTKEQLECCGLFFSKLFNAVESEEWANIREETGDGGATLGFKGKVHSEETKREYSETRKGRKFPNRKSSGPHSEEHRNKLSLALNGKPQGPRGSMSEEHKAKLRKPYKSRGIKRGPRGPYKIGVK